MTDLRQAAQLALEALETCGEDAWPKVPKAIYALRAALEQQAEPVAWDKPSVSFNDWWNGDYDDAANPFEKDSAAHWAWAGWKAGQRQWVGLTDDEILEAAQIDGADTWVFETAYAIEAKLKAKNDR